MKLHLTAIALAVLAVLACSDDNEREFAADLTGANEVPPVTTTAAGASTYRLNSDQTSLAFTLNITSAIDSANAAHIHVGRAGVNGPPVVTLWLDTTGMDYTGQLASGTITAPDLIGPMAGKTIAELAESLAVGATYANVHTRAYPAGEIRGQIAEE